MRRTLITIGIAAVAALGFSAAADAGSKPLLIANCLKPKFEPKSVIIACGDASLGATGITWSSWTQKSAVGTGTGQINDCTPDCVHGHTKMAPMQLSLSKPKKCPNGRRLFTKLRYTWTSGAPVGPASAAIPFGCKLLNL
jgi:hypothetical protein